jgi:hypothetical protein
MESVSPSHNSLSLTKKKEFSQEVNSSMVEVLCAGTRGECRIVLRASFRYKWPLTWDRLKQSKRKSGIVFEIQPFYKKFAKKKHNKSLIHASG